LATSDKAGEKMVMRVYVEGEDYGRWVEDFEYYVMGLGLA